MQGLANLRCVLKKKARIYAWLLVGFIPTWVCGLVEPTEPRPVCLLISTVSVVASLWIVIWRWEAIEQRRIARRVRILLLGISFLVGFAVFATFVEWRAGSIRGMDLPLVLSSAPLSAVLAMVRLDAGSAAPLGSVSDPPELVVVFVILFGTPVVWSAMAALAASPCTRRRTHLFMGTILSHYLGAVIAVALMTAADWRDLNEAWHVVPEALAGWALVYVGAHVLLWRSFLRNRIKNDGGTAVASSPFRAIVGIPDPE